jgi:hypothetical protein
MNPKLLLRIAAIIMFLHAMGHTIGIYTWKKETSHVSRELVTQMTGQKFSFMGATATMGAFYDGLGVCFQHCNVNGHFHSLDNFRDGWKILSLCCENSFSGFAVPPFPWN